MKPLSPQQLVYFRVPEDANCLSLYASSPAEFEDLLAQAVFSGRGVLPSTDLDRLLRPLRRWKEGRLEEVRFPAAFFVTKGFSGYIPIPFPVRGIQVVSRSFHVKPLLKWLQREHPFSLLLLGHSRASIYQGSLGSLVLRDHLEYGGLRTLNDIFDSLDRALFRAAPASRAPLLLAGDPDLIENFRSVSAYRMILEEPIAVNAEAASPEWLHRQSMRILEPYLDRSESWMLEQFRNAQRSGKAASSLSEIVANALAGKVKLLFVNEAIHLWGHIDEASGTFACRTGKPDGAEDDVLDDLAEIVLRHQGQVAVLPGPRMPGGRAACAVLRGVEPAWGIVPNTSAMEVPIGSPWLIAN